MPFPPGAFVNPFYAYFEHFVPWNRISVINMTNVNMCFFYVVLGLWRCPLLPGWSSTTKWTTLVLPMSPIPLVFLRLPAILYGREKDPCHQLALWLCWVKIQTSNWCLERQEAQKLPLKPPWYKWQDDLASLKPKRNFAAFQVMLRNLWLGQDILQATDDVRIHHQLAPMVLFHEPGWSQVRMHQGYIYSWVIEIMCFDSPPSLGSSSYHYIGLAPPYFWRNFSNQLFGHI